MTGVWPKKGPEKINFPKILLGSSFFHFIICLDSAYLRVFIYLCLLPCFLSCYVESKKESKEEKE